MSIIIPGILNDGQVTTANIDDNAVTQAKLAHDIDVSHLINDAGYITNVSSFDTDDVSEGSTNLYFTDERVDDRVNLLLQEGNNITLTYDDVANTLTIAATEDNLANNSIFDLGDVSGSDAYGNLLIGTGSGFAGAAGTTDLLSEGTNKYFTDARAISAVEGEATLDLTGEVTVTGNVSDKITTIGDFNLSNNTSYKAHGFNVAGGNEAWASATFTEHEGNANKPFSGFTNAGITGEVWGGEVGSETALGSGKRLIGIYAQGSYDDGGTITQPATAPARFIISTTEAQTSSARGTKVDLQTTIQGSTTRVTTASFNGNNTTLINLFATGEVVFSNLPTSDPGNPGQLWNDLGTLKVS